MTNPTILPPILTLKFDGGCNNYAKTNRVAVGAWVLLDGDEILERGGKPITANTVITTSNTAEWGGLLLGLQYLEKADWRGTHLHIRGDSTLVVEQLRGRWGSYKPHLTALRDKCLDILYAAPYVWDAAWIPRVSNQIADDTVRWFADDYRNAGRPARMLMFAGDTVPV